VSQVIEYLPKKGKTLQKHLRKNKEKMQMTSKHIKMKMQIKNTIDITLLLPEWL
jgi:hypothetical protein